MQGKKNKLTFEQIEPIRLDYEADIMTVKQISAKYGISVGTIYTFVRGGLWQQRKPQIMGLRKPGRKRSYVKKEDMKK